MDAPSDSQVFATRVIGFRGTKRRIVLQDRNGPCPLLAIVNLLSLRGDLLVPLMDTARQTTTAGALINTVASAAGGLSPHQDKGMLAGEVHDCGDVRIEGATVDTDAAHEGDMFYFGHNETNPLPDRRRFAEGTSKLGLFGALNVTTGIPVRISAIGNHNGQTVLLGTHTVQAFKGALTTVRLRGRRPWQK